MKNISIAVVDYDCGNIHSATKAIELAMSESSEKGSVSLTKDPEEIIKSVDDGIYANNFGGGQVDITSGKFVFSASQAWVIKNGKLIHPIKGASIVGNGPEILNEVSMVGNDMQLDTGVGTCGKDGQSVPVGVGQPTLKIDNIIVGGTN